MTLKQPITSNKFSVTFNNVSDEAAKVLREQVVKIAPFSLFPINRMGSNIHSTMYIFFEEDATGELGKAFQEIWQNQGVAITLTTEDSNGISIQTITFTGVVLKDVRLGGFDYNGHGSGDFTGGTLLNRASFRYTNLTRQ